LGATADEIAAGHAFYTKRSLAVYDVAILGLFCRMAWRCPARRIVAHYDQHVSGSHLDIGVGTGYFLDHCTFPTATPRVALLDPNPNCLEVASRRLERFSPEMVQADILQPVAYSGDRFDSFGMNFLLHCLPGDFTTKAAVFEHVRPLANTGATVFGATLLHDGVQRNWFARSVMARNNKHRIFSNASDSLDGLRNMLESHLSSVTVDVAGCVGIFAGRL
jgi:ubiquinone/menaquinone biosynthesis C-methylase UbiE